MKILIIGDGNHQFIREQVKWLRKKSTINQIDIFSVPPIKNDKDPLYDNIYNAYSNSILTRIRRIRVWVKEREIRKRLKDIPDDYDIIQIHYVSSWLPDIIDLIKSKGRKLAVSMWGSDFYRASAKDNTKKKIIYQLADAITFFVDDATQKDFSKTFPDISKEKFHTCKFGSAPLTPLKAIMEKHSKEYSKKTLELNIDKIIITIGYNLRKAQRHLPIVENIVNSKNYAKYKEKIQFVFPITYPQLNKYKKELITKLKNLDVDFVIFDEFLSDEKVAHLRYASDVMIQLQPTDVLSDSMQEHIFARNIVITGDWLPYDELTENGIYFHQIPKVENIGTTLFKCLENLTEEKKRCEKNTQLMGEYGSWEKNIESWIKLYEDFVN